MNAPGAAAQLKSIVERIERLEEEKAGIAADIVDIYTEAKANGFDAKAIRQIVRDRKLSKTERDEFEAVLDTYRAALGMLPEFTQRGGDPRQGDLEDLIAAKRPDNAKKTAPEPSAFETWESPS